MYGMNRILTEIGWAAVAVDGFIPMLLWNFRYNVLVIASDIRQLEHIEYTPAPDIIHMKAGHAPLLRIQNMQNIYVVLRNRLQSHFI
jgi:phenylalanine-4-hydroxylase